MDNGLYLKSKKFVQDAFVKAKNPIEIDHAERTVKWIKRLRPDADEALLAAGLLHDIERAFYGDWKKGSNKVDALIEHQNKSAMTAKKFLRDINADKFLIEKIIDLVIHHEEGGSEEQNVLCDADCLAYLEEKAVRLASDHKKRNMTKDQVKEKLNYVLRRINSPEAKSLAQPIYNKAVKILYIE